MSRLESPDVALEVRLFRAINRVVEPRVRAGWGSPRLAPGGLVVLETRGRKSGRRSRLPLAALRFREYVLVSSVRGCNAGWVKNLVARPDVRFWIGGRQHRAHALVFSPEHRARIRADLPQPIRLLLQLLLPYTWAGWAFALLVPAEVKARSLPAA